MLWQRAQHLLHPGLLINYNQENNTKSTRISDIIWRIKSQLRVRTSRPISNTTRSIKTMRSKGSSSRPQLVKTVVWEVAAAVSNTTTWDPGRRSNPMAWIRTQAAKWCICILLIRQTVPFRKVWSTKTSFISTKTTSTIWDYQIATQSSRFKWLLMPWGTRTITTCCCQSKCRQVKTLSIQAIATPKMETKIRIIWTI